MAKPGSMIWGVLLLLFGAALLGWAGYNVLVERLPATKGKSPLHASLFGIGAVIAGVFRIRGQKPPPYL
jgi:drug/metabolite transporter (DMT)-like permease